MPKLIQFSRSLIDYGVERFMPEKIYTVRSSTLDSRFMTSHGKYCIIADDRLNVFHVGIELGKASRFYVEKKLGWDFARYDHSSAEVEGEEDESKEGDDGKEKTESTGEGGEKDSIPPGGEDTGEPKLEGTDGAPEGGGEGSDEGDGGGEEPRVEEGDGDSGGEDPELTQDEKSPHVGNSDLVVEMVDTPPVEPEEAEVTIRLDDPGEDLKPLGKVIQDGIVRNAIEESVESAFPTGKSKGKQKGKGKGKGKGKKKS